MKPHKLSITGLQSFREQQDIDFSRLSDLGMFGIFGPTGSGKSTILDAITLALYGKVGRAKSGKQGVINESENHAAVSFEFSLGTDSERQTYRVERKYRTRDHVSVNSTLSRLVELRQNDEIVLADQENAVNEKLVEILGITLDDFVRAVVLPQGKFSDFLTLAGVNRRKMLERLFSLEQYGDKLAYRVKKRKEETENRYSALQGEMQGMGNASREAVDAEFVKVQDSQAVSKQADDYYEEVRQLSEGAAKVVDLQMEISRKQQELARHRERSSEIDAIERQAVQAEKAAQVKPWLDKTTEAQLRCEQAEKNAEIAIAQENIAKETSSAKQQEYAQAQESRSSKEPGLIVKRGQVEDAQFLETQLAADDNKLAEMAKQLSQLVASLQAVNGELQAKADQVRMIDQELNKLQGEFSSCQVAAERRNAVVDANERVNQWEQCRKIAMEAIAERSVRDLEMQAAIAAVQANIDVKKQNGAVRAQLEEKLTKLKDACPIDELKLAEEKTRLARCEIHVRNLGKIHADIDNAAITLEGLRKKHAASVKETEEAENCVQVTRKESDQIQNELNEVIQNDKRKMAVALAQDLAAGSACPVCGSTEHPQIAHPEIVRENEERSEHLKTFIEEKLGALKQAETLLNDIRGYSMQMAAQIAAEHSQQETRIKQAAALCREVFSELGLANEIAEVQVCLAVVAARNQQYDLDKVSLENWQQSKEELSKKMEGMLQQETRNAASLAAARQKQESAAAEQDKTLQKLHAAQLQVDMAESFMAGAAMVLGASRDLSPTDQAVYVKKTAAEIKRMDATRDELTKKISERQAERKAQEEMHSILRSRVQELELKQAGKKADHDNLSAGLLENRQRLVAVTGGILAAELLRKIGDAIDELQTKERMARTAWENADKQRQAASATAAAATASLAQNQENWKLSEMQMKREIETAGFADSKEAKAAQLASDILEQSKNAIREYRENGLRVAAEVRMVEKELDGRIITDTEWNALKQRLARSETDKNEKKRVAIEADHTHRELATKHQRWSEIDAELLLVRQNLDNLEKIYGLIRGNMLVEFLAQEQMKVVLHNASERLKQLTHNRYALEIDSEGNFLVRDDANGGARRPAASLSGGETFQTSLALALALSDQIQLRGKYPLEFFFLDEGFGSLDRNTLDISMATLERLRHDRLTIGIISHVEELQQRMPRRLIVSQPDMLGHGSRVKIEIA